MYNKVVFLVEDIEKETVVQKYYAREKTGRKRKELNFKRARIENKKILFFKGWFFVPSQVVDSIYRRIY